MTEQEKIHKLRLYLIKNTKGLINVDTQENSKNFTFRYTVNKYSTEPTTIKRFLKEAIESNKKAIEFYEKLLNEE